MKKRLNARPRVCTALTAIGLCCVLACDWTEFDLEDTAPVVLLTPAGGVSGFGQTLATQTDGKRVILLVGGDPGNSASAAYSLGIGQQPAQDSSQGGYCSSDNPRVDPCFTASNAAALPLENKSKDLDVCFVYGWGKAEDDDEEGLVARCQDAADITIEVDSEIVDERRDRLKRTREPQPLFFATDRASRPALVAGLPEQNAAWFYGPDVRRRAPVTLKLPTGNATPKSFGSQVAVARLGEGIEAPRLIAVSAPAAGQLWLFRSEKSSRFGTADAVGCLGVRKDFGRTLATGRVDDDEIDDLVVAEDGVVSAFSGAALRELPPAYGNTCSMGALPPDAIIASFTCGSRMALAGCDDSEFGASLAVADLDGDGDGEIVVGAPGMTVNGRAQGGAALVYDAEGSTRHELSDVLYISSAEKHDRLGVAVAAVRQGNRDIVVAGAPGNSKAALFYCSDLLPKQARTGRCAL